MYEIYAYGNNDSLFGIFNAIAAIIGSNSYIQSIAIVVFVGFVAAAFAYAFAPQKMIGWQWLASVLLVYTVLLVPKVTVGIVDKLGTQPVQVVSNVPFGVALFGHLTSAIGNALTETFETAFQVLPASANLPADLTYQRHGLLFANTLIRRTRAVVFDDPNFRTDMVNFIHNCTMFDLADGTINPSVFSRAPVGAGDVWSLMSSPNPARFSSITTGGMTDIQPCPAVYANLNLRMPAVTNLSMDKMATILNPDLPFAQAITQVANQMTQAYLRTQLGNAASTAADIVRQNALINSVSDTSDIIGQRINDPASLLLSVGRAQATAQTNAAWMNFGKMAENALPLIRNAIEAIIYALFPFIILLLFITHGVGTMRALQSYLATLVWIQLWPPVYAILNYMASLASAKHIAAAAELGAGIKGLSILTASSVYANTISDQAVVGYLTLAVPAIAWAAVKGMETIGQAALTGVSNLQGTTAAASATAGTGNLSMGNVGMDHVGLSPNTSSAYMRMMTNAWGTQTTGFQSGSEVMRYQQNMSRLATNFGFSEREATTMSDSAREAEALSVAKREAAAQSTSAALVSAMTMRQEFGRTGTRSVGSANGTGGRDSRDLSSLIEIADNVNKMLGYEGNVNAGKQVVADLAAGASAGRVASLGVDFHGKIEEQERAKRAYDYAQREIQNRGIATGKQVAHEFRTTDAYDWATRSGTSGSAGFDSSLREAEDYTRTAEKAHMESWELARMAQFMRELSSNVSSDASNYLYERLEATGRFDEYLGSGPLAQKQLTYDIARDYARGASGMNNLYTPYDGGSTPSRRAGSLLHMGDFNEAYRWVPLEGGSDAEIRAANAAQDAIARLRQGHDGVVPSQGVADDVTSRTNDGLNKLRAAQDRAGAEIVGQAKQLQDENRRGLATPDTKVWGQFARDVSEDANTVLEAANGINRDEPKRPRLPPAPGQGRAAPK